MPPCCGAASARRHRRVSDRGRRRRGGACRAAPGYWGRNSRAARGWIEPGSGDSGTASLGKNPNVFADLSARFHRPWQLYNGLILALEYKVEGKLLFGTDFPVATPEAAIAQFRGLNRMVEGTNLPRIPERVIDEVLYERPFALLGLPAPSGGSPVREAP